MKTSLTPAAKQQLDGAVVSIRADITDLARHFTGTIGKLSGHIDERFSRIDEQLIEVNTKLDAIMSGEILVTRKQIERLIEALRVKGIELNVNEILAA